MDDQRSDDQGIHRGAYSVICYRCNATVQVGPYTWSLDLAGDDERVVQAWAECPCGCTTLVRAVWSRFALHRSEGIGA